MGLSLFVLAAAIQDRPADPLTWPIIAPTVDQCSSGVSAINFAKRVLGINIDEFYDPSHGCWNDEKKTMGDVGLKSWLLLMMVAINVMDGPWANNGRYNESWEALVALAKNVTDPMSLPLFVSLLPMMAIEAKVPLDDPHLAAKVWKALFLNGPLSKKGYKCNLNRFYGFVTVSLSEVEHFFMKLFIFLYVSLEMDYIGGANVPKLAISQSASSSDPATASTSNTIKSAEEKALRSACGNAYGIATMMYSDPGNLFRWKIVLNAGIT